MTLQNLRGEWWGAEVPEYHTWDIVFVDGRSYLAGDDDNGMMQLLKTSLPPGSWQIICLSGECSEEVAYDITGIPSDIQQPEIAILTLSFLLESKGLNPNNTLILKKQ